MVGVFELVNVISRIPRSNPASHHQECIIFIGDKQVINNITSFTIQLLFRHLHHSL